MNRVEEPGRGRVARAIAWTGAGLLVGALLLAVGTVAANLGAHEWDLRDGIGGWWFLSVVIAGLVLVYGIRWDRDALRALDDESAERRYVLWLTAFSVAGAVLAWIGFPGEALEAIVTDARMFDPSPVVVSMWLVVCTVTLGCLFMLSSPGVLRLHPRKRSLPFVAAGALAVVLVGGLVAVVVSPREPHTVATDLGDPAPVPVGVSRVGWSWEPPMGTNIKQVRAGTHGPLVLFSDGAVALDGTTGEELWSYRRPFDHARRVGTDGGGVYVRYATDHAAEDNVTVTLDAGSGEIRDRAPDFLPLVVMDPLSENHESSERLKGALGAGPNCFPSQIERYGDRLVGVLGCVEEEDADGNWEFDDPFTWEDVEVQVVVAAVDLATDEEAWRHEWTVRPSDEHTPRLIQVRAGQGDPVVVLNSGPDQVPALLDPATGEEVVELPGRLTGRLTADEMYQLLVQADSEGVVFVEETGEARTSFHRTNTAGEITGTAVLEDTFVGKLGRIAVLDDMLLIPETRYEMNEGEEEARIALFAVPFGETVDRESAHGIALGGHPFEDVVAVPGALVVHTGEEDSHRIDGLVP